MAGLTTAVRSADQTVSQLRALASYAKADLDRTFPIRIFKWGRETRYEPALEPVIRTLNDILPKYPKLPRILNDFDAAYARAVACTKPSAAAPAIAILKKKRADWQSFIETYTKEKSRDAAEEFDELLRWIDRDLQERLAIARLRGDRTTASSGVASTRRAAVAADPAAAYNAFMRAARSADTDTREALIRLAAYLRRDDPVWNQIGQKVAGFDRSAPAQNLENAIQGVLGEALALRNPWVVEALATAVDRGKQLATKLGTDWKVVVVETPVRASTRTARGAGMGELYDSSVWLVRRPKRGNVALEAAPVWVLQVKSGKVSEAAEQVASDVHRELGKHVEIPTSAAGAVEMQRYEVRNLRELLNQSGVTADKAAWAKFGTQRVLVAARPPSDTSLAANLPSWVSVDFIEAMMTKGDLRRASKAIAAAIQG